MGSCCSRKEAVNQTQPDTETMKVRSNTSSSSDATSPPNPVPSQDEANIEDNLIDDFREAIKQGNDTMVMFYIEEYPSMELLAAKFANNETPLQIAVKHQKYHVIEKLLDQGANVNAIDPKTGDTVLHIATRQNNIKILKLLIEYGGDASFKNIDEETVLSIAVEHHYNDIVKEIGGKDAFNVNAADYIPTFGGPSSSLKVENGGDGRMSTKHINYFADDILLSSPTINEKHNEEELSAMGTVRLTDIADDIFEDIKTSLRDTRSHLVTLQSWLEKKQQAPPYSWLKRWVIVKDEYLLWSDRQITVEHGVTEEEKRRWNKCIKLRDIKDISAIQDKKERKFKLSVQGVNREYIWRAKSKERRDQWIDGLKGHVTQAKQEKAFNSTPNILMDVISE